MKKTIITLILTATMVFTLTSCGQVAEAMETYNERKELVDHLKEEVGDEKSIRIDGDNEAEIDLDAAINDALEADGAQMIDNEGDLRFDIPEDFSYNTETGVYTTRDAMANFSYDTMDNDGSFIWLTKEDYEAALEEEYTRLMQQEIDMTITSWEKVTVDGYEAIRYSVEYDIVGIHMCETQFIINGTDKMHFFTHTQNGITKYNDALLAMEETLRFE